MSFFIIILKNNNRNYVIYLNNIQRYKYFCKIYIIIVCEIYQTFFLQIDTRNTTLLQTHLLPSVTIYYFFENQI